MAMDTVLLLIHIAFGSVALLTAALAFLTEKGPKFHAKVGRIYALAMIGVGSVSYTHLTLPTKRIV